MESSRFAFLLARFMGLTQWTYLVFNAFLIPDRLLEVGSARYVSTKHYYEGLLFLSIGRLVLQAGLGLFFWMQAPRVAGWLEGKAKEEVGSDAPPLPHP